MSTSKSSRPAAPDICPVCGEEVPPRAVACPECGADHNSGWQADAESSDALGATEDFDYEAFVRNEFGSSPKPTGIKPVWWIAALLLLLAFAIIYFVERL